MAMSEDSLQVLPVERWSELEREFKKDFPRGIPVCAVLREQKKWLQKGIGYGFQVFVPNGDVTAGLVGVNQKKNFYEIIIQCPQNDTSQLEEALIQTEVINLKRYVIVPFTPPHVIECIKRVVKKLNITLDVILPSESFIVYAGTQLFDEFWIEKHPDLTISLLSDQYVDLVDSSWPHRYHDSKWYFLKLIEAQSGYGLFRRKELVAWIFINEAGILGHLFTLEGHRNMGYAEILLKHISNILLREQKDVVAFCVKGNVGACKLYAKAGFQNFGGRAWCYINKDIVN